MDKNVRNAIERATQRARKLLEEDFGAQLEGTFDILRDGKVAAKAGPHLAARQVLHRDKIVAAIDHKRAAGMSATEAVADYVRDAAFTTLNRFVALKMLEARELVQQCITKGEQSAGYREFCGMAAGVALLPEGAGYRLYIESLFDELSTEVKVLFDRRDPASVLWPKRATFEALLEILNDTELTGVWGEDETIGWVYQYFNGGDERRAMREASQAPRNSRELAVRNQFFTPRYVVQFLTDNTLGRIWYEMRGGQTVLIDRCEYMVRRPDETFAPRPKKDPRDIRVLDPACGSGHFLLYAFDLLIATYEEAYADADSPKSEATGKTLAADFSSIDALRRALPALILAHNLHGVDIDSRCAQIAQLALWMRAQRAFRDFSIGRAERPQIRRSNIVVAEPLVADEATTKDFVARLGDAELGRVFTNLVDTLKLAGELGLLLRVEGLVSRGPKRGQTGDLFAPPEVRIRAALDAYIASEGVRASMRRRLFVDDAVQGMGLLATAEKRFDVVLMNPPFGLLTNAGQKHLAANYRGAHNDVFAAFVRRASSLSPDGLVGAITSRSFLVTKRLEAFRRVDVIPGLRCLWDLGLGVMDSASVESAAYVIGPSTPSDILAADGRSSSGPDYRSPTSWRFLKRNDVLKLPLAKILYDLPPDVHRILSLPAHFEPAVGTAREGMKSFDNERFVRLFWEVDSDEIGKSWMRFAKGGRNLRIFYRHPLVLSYVAGGAELDEKNRQVNSSTSQVRQASDFWFKPGVTYSRRAPEFAPRVLPAEHIFSDKGPAVLAHEGVGPAFLLGWLNSRLVRYLVHLQAHKQDFLTGILKKLPWAAPSRAILVRVEGAVQSALAAWMEVQVRDETSPYFRVYGTAKSVDEFVRELAECEDKASRALKSCFEVCDREIDSMYMADSSQWPGLAVHDDEEEIDAGELDEQSDPVANLPVVRLVSWGVGVALSRWGIGINQQLPDRGDLFQGPPRRQPGELDEYIEDVALPEDSGHPKDIVRRVTEIFAKQWERDLEEVAIEFDNALGPGGLRSFLRDPRKNGFWRHHVDAYSAQRRTAPILWRLGTLSGDYSIWLNFRRADRDTLYQVLQSFVDPKLRYEESRISELRNQMSTRTRRDLARQISAQEKLLTELKKFRHDLAQVSPLWVPNLRDGVVVCMAPLWRLVPFDSAFQNELESAWRSLCGGEYDWAHLAMHLWPERVVPKCATDRSLAIVHGIEEEFWIEGDDGKWKARATPLRPIDELVRERTSPAVKAALQSLLDAPATQTRKPSTRSKRAR